MDGFYSYVKDDCDGYIEAENYVEVSVVEASTLLVFDLPGEHPHEVPIWMKNLEATYGWKITSCLSYPTAEKIGRYGDALRDLAMVGALSEDVICTVNDMIVRSFSLI